jgi:hypothetical protein
MVANLVATLAGVPLLDVSRMLGHHSPAFTLSTYSHVTAADRVPVDAIFGKGRDERDPH